MNAATGEWSLQRVVMRYSETAGASLGVRFLFKNLLPRWKLRNPQVEVVTQHSQYEHPEMLCEFRTGESCTVSLRMLRPTQIERLMDLYRNSHSPNLFLRHGGPRVWTERRSIQGLWQPSYEGMTAALKFAHNKDRKRMRLKYSKYSLDLSRQSLEGRGRWGDEEEVRRGFDRSVLKAVFREPYLPGAQPLEVRHINPETGHVDWGIVEAEDAEEKIQAKMRVTYGASSTSSSSSATTAASSLANHLNNNAESFDSFSAGKNTTDVDGPTRLDDDTCAEFRPDYPENPNSSAFFDTHIDRVSSQRRYTAKDGRDLSHLDNTKAAKKRLWRSAIDRRKYGELGANVDGKIDPEQVHAS